jgi:hypothetical protein
MTDTQPLTRALDELHEYLTSTSIHRAYEAKRVLETDIAGFINDLSSDSDLGMTSGLAISKHRVGRGPLHLGCCKCWPAVDAGRE